MPDIFEKYKADIISKDFDVKDKTILFADFNDNGISEKIEFRQTQSNFFNLTIFENGKVIDQWNFDGIFLNISGNVVTNIGQDSTKSIYFLTLNDAKIYLYCLNPYENRFITEAKFIADYKIKGVRDCLFNSGIFYDNDKDGLNEFYFSSNVGYSKQPRKVIKYNPANDSIYISCESYAAISEKMISDTSSNELNLVLASSAYGNSAPSDPYSDMFAWLMCYDSNLDLKYKPSKIGYYPSNSTIVPILINKKQLYCCMNIYTGTQSHLCALRLFNSKLKMEKEKKFLYSSEWHGASLYSSNDQINSFYIIRTNGHIEELDNDFNVITDKFILPIAEIPFYSIDIDGDNKDELIFISRYLDNLIITRNDFSNYVLVNCTGSGTMKTCSPKLNGNNPPELFVQFDNVAYIIKYDFNLLYNFKYPLYALIYFGVFLIILLIQKTQQHQAELKYRAERKIAELQLKAIKNQVDPHYTLNIINSIGSLFYKQDNDKANYVFGKYSKMLRSTILNSDKILTILSEEVDYVKNYLELEQFRHNNNFKWEVNIGENVNMDLNIPKMLIHTFAENAIKHGLRHLEKNGMLLISITFKDDEHIILIKDNGIGRIESKTYQIESTGRGLQILDQILELYFSLTKIRISYDIKDLFTDNSQAAGTVVFITIPSK